LGFLTPRGIVQSSATMSGEPGGNGNGNGSKAIATLTTHRLIEREIRKHN
jgi:hypothetical protein